MAITRTGIIVFEEITQDALDAIRDDLRWTSTELSRFTVDDIGGLEFVNDEGKITKRIAAHARKLGYRLSNDTLGLIGSRLSMYKIGEVRYELSREFDWDSGEFGDRGSCFWGGKAHARAAMRSDWRCASVRLWNTYGHGIARAWVTFTEHGIVIWNAYGYSTQAIANALASRWGVKAYKVLLVNHGETNGRVWINNSNGYLLRGKGDLREIVCTVDLDIWAGIKCAECGKYTEYYTEVQHTHELMCRTCLENTCRVCYNCGLPVRSRDIVVSRCGYRVCPECSAEERGK